MEVQWRSDGGPAEVRWRYSGGQIEVQRRSDEGQRRSDGGPAQVRGLSGGCPQRGVVKLARRSQTASCETSFKETNGIGSFLLFVEEPFISR